MIEYTKALGLALDTLQNNPLVPQSIATFIRSVIDIQRNSPPLISSIPPSTVTQESFATGTPFYNIEQFVYDKQSSATIFGQLLALLAHDPTYTTPIHKLKHAMEEGNFSLENAFTAYLSMDKDFFEKWNTHLQITSSLLFFLLQLSLSPSLEACAHHMRNEYSMELWTEQYCPCCGGEPLLAYWLGSVGKQHNICSLCSTEYRVARMQCPYCGEKNHDALRYIATQEVPSLHIQTCATCKSYIKILEKKGVSLPLTPHIDDVNTLVIDVVAKQQGFSRPVLSAFGF